MTDRSKRCRGSSARAFAKATESELNRPAAAAGAWLIKSNWNEAGSMHIIKSVGVLSVAKILGLVYGCMGLLFAPFFLLFGLIGSVAGQGRSPDRKSTRLNSSH